MRLRFPSPACLVLGPSLVALTLAGASRAGEATVPPTLQAYNVILHAQLETHSGANDVWGYTSPGGVELAIWGHSDGTAFVDATDPANAVEVFNLPGPLSVWRDIKTYDHYAYIVTEGAAAGTGLQIVDLSDPLQPIHLSTYTANGFTTAHNIWIDTDAAVAYACGGSAGGTHILSLADPENPVQIDYFSPYYIHDLYVGDGLGYAGAISSGTLRIMDTSTPSNPVTIATHGYPGAATHAAWPNVAGTHVVTADETLGGHVQIWDITNLSNIQFVSEVFAGDGVIHNIFGIDDLVYCSWYASGTRILDITDPADPIEVGFYDTSPRSGSGYNGNWGVYPFRGDGILYSTDRQEGLFLLEFTGSFAGTIEGVVTDSGAQPLAGVEVTLLDTPYAPSTAADGSYGARVGGNTYDVVTSKFGYFPDTTAVSVPPGGAVTHDVQLTVQPTGSVELTVTGAVSGQPVEGVLVNVADTPLAGFVTDGLGQVLLSGLPAGTPWTVQANRFGFFSGEVIVTAPVGGTGTEGVQLLRGFDDDFERDQAWSVGPAGDDATGGVWERAVPVGSYFNGIVGPEEDASPTGVGLAYVTEQHIRGTFVGTSDVDNGHTTLLTPVFDGSGLGDLTLSYQRWFSNRAPIPGTDEFRVDVSTNGGGSWTNLETVSVGTDAWAAVVIDLSAAVVPTSTMQLRFVAEDAGSEHYVEAALDDVVIATPATSVRPVSAGLQQLSLRTTGPNPFRDATTFEFGLTRSGRAALDIFDVSGRRVVTLLESERLGAGTHRVGWNGRDAAGVIVSPGVYFARVKTTGGAVSRKVTFVR